MNTLESFKDTKRELKQTLNKIEDQFESLDGTEDFDQLQKQIKMAKQSKVKIDKLYGEMEAQWKMLNPSEKA